MMLNRRCFALMVCFLLLRVPANAQQITVPNISSPGWTMPYEPFRMVGNVYWVGTYDLGCYLVTTPAGHILINTGLAESDSVIKKHVEQLGFKITDIKILLTTQAHFDHMGAMASLKKMSGAQFWVDEKDADVALTGGRTDYALGHYGMSYLPVKPDRLLKDGDTISLGGTNLVLLHHPGHTMGSCSYLFTVKDDNRSYRVLIANMPSIVVETPFSEVTAYPSVVADYTATFKAMKNLQFDLWFASHASQFDMHRKHKPGDAYNPLAFEDRKGYDKALGNLQKLFLEKMKAESAR